MICVAPGMKVSSVVARPWRKAFLRIPDSLKELCLVSRTENSGQGFVAVEPCQARLRAAV